MGVFVLVLEESARLRVIPLKMILVLMLAKEGLENMFHPREG
jgi:hypothetical protein